MTRTHISDAAQQYIDLLDAHYESHGLTGLSEYLWTLCEADGLIVLDWHNADETLSQTFEVTV
jgi:hypothetical protein